ncbi:hypothetical protein C2U70_12380 [Bradyrhizobium guangdongense]|nr:hypothetical protein C2U70_12380 [Bradyrhizobium guangdongense]
MRGEAGLHRRCNPGEGDVPRVQLSPSPRGLPLAPTLSARAKLVAAPHPPSPRLRRTRAGRGSRPSPAPLPL